MKNAALDCFSALESAGEVNTNTKPVAVPYLQHFGLREAPFGITPDTSFVFHARSQQEALNTLLIALGAGEGFVKIVGEVGTGKTLLCRRLLRAFQDSPDWVTAYLPNPGLPPDELLAALAAELHLAVPESIPTFSLTRTINEALLEIAGRGQRVMVCLDEAQAIPKESLEALRLLSNLETEKRKLMQIVLFGQPELDVHLDDPSIRQLRQRITFSYRLGVLSREEVNFYLAHRLRIAGCVQPGVFSRSAMKAIYKVSHGTPRLVNILANKALIAVFGEGGGVVKSKHVKAAARDTEGVRVRFWW